MSKKLLSDLIEEWIETQMSEGKTRDDIAGTHFAYNGQIAVLGKLGKNKFKLDTYLNPKAVFFD